MTYKQRGVRGFWAGFGLTIVKSLLSSGVSLPLFDVFKPRFRGSVEGVIFGAEAAGAS